MRWSLVLYKRLYLTSYSYFRLVLVCWSTSVFYESTQKMRKNETDNETNFFSACETWIVINSWTLARNDSQNSEEVKINTSFNYIHYATVTPVSLASNVALAVAHATSIQPPPSTTYLKMNANLIHTDLDAEPTKRLLDQDSSNGLASSLNDLKNCFSLQILVIDGLRFITV